MRTIEERSCFDGNFARTVFIRRHPIEIRLGQLVLDAPFEELRCCLNVLLDGKRNRQLIFGNRNMNTPNLRHFRGSSVNGLIDKGYNLKWIGVDGISANFCQRLGSTKGSHTVLRRIVLHLLIPIRNDFSRKTRFFAVGAFDSVKNKTVLGKPLRLCIICFPFLLSKETNEDGPIASNFRVAPVADLNHTKGSSDGSFDFGFARHQPLETRSSASLWQKARGTIDAREIHGS
jgi:hypothetical protein